MENNFYNEPKQEEPIQTSYEDKETEYSYGEGSLEGSDTYYRPEQPQPEPKTGLAIASLVLGIISVVLFCTGYNIISAIIAIVLGAVYLSKKQEARRGMAIAGIVLGIISIVLFVLMIVIVVVFTVGAVASDPLFTQMLGDMINGTY